MRRRDKMAKLFCAEGAGPESISLSILWPDGFSDVQLHIKVRSLHSRPGMTARKNLDCFVVLLLDARAI
jgi:hypothetical protein